MDLKLYPLRFTFSAEERICFPAGAAGNILRGAFGMALRRAACTPDCPGARECPRRSECAYARLFEPWGPGEGPSGFADPPRPFVFRAASLEGLTIAPGEIFHFDFHLFDTRGAAAEILPAAFEELGRSGIGPGRGKARLVEARRPPAPLALSLVPPPDRITHVRIRFVTPTELKAGERLAGRPEFGALAARIRDRVGALRQLYGDGPLELDYRGFGERAAMVRMTWCDVRRVEGSRRSSRTGQTHPIGGFTGEAEYEGDLGEFIPYLKAAEWTGVGRQTVWGKGQIQLL